MSNAAQPVETPSGKGAGDENFPVGSFLIARRLRPHVAAYYRYARAIDDIADNPALDPEEKLRRLDMMELALAGALGRGNPGLTAATTLRESLLQTDVPFSTALDLISAFKQDAEKSRYADWAELMDYCDRSAAPVGRFLLHLHGETSQQAFSASDALCKALQVINHLQDCKDDYVDLDRVYLPQQWLEEAGETVAALGAPMCSPGLRKTIDRCLNGVRDLMEAARPLPSLLSSRRLAMESAVIVEVAEALVYELAGRDPLARKVKLTKGQYLACAVKGIWRGLIG